MFGRPGNGGVIVVAIARNGAIYIMRILKLGV
jgi:hemin uptake protein HemP